MAGEDLERLWTPWRSEYVTSAGEGEGCIFCDHLAQGDDRAARILHRGGQAFVILNAFPYNTGHLMVAPLRHVGDICELEDDERNEMMSLTSESIAIIRSAMNAHGFNVGMNLGTRRRRGNSRSHSHARRAALGRRHELHAGSRQDEGAPGDDRPNRRETATVVRSTVRRRRLGLGRGQHEGLVPVELDHEVGELGVIGNEGAELTCVRLECLRFQFHELGRQSQID